MQLFIEGIEMQLVEGQSIPIQVVSPLKEFKLTGAKSQSFTIYNNDAFKQACEYGTHLQSDTLKESYAAVIQDGPIRFADKARIKRISNNAVTLEMSMPPGGIPADVWNQNLTTFSLGSHTFDSSIIQANVYNFTLTEIQSSQTLGRWLGANGTTLKFFDGPSAGSYKFFEISFYNFGLDFETREAKAYSDLTTAIEEFNATPPVGNAKIQLFYTKNNLTVISDIHLPVRIEVYYDPTLLGVAQIPQTYNFAATRLSYESKTVPSSIPNAPFRFETIFVPNFYNGKSLSYSGYINAKNNGTLKSNTFLERTAYPLVPSFQFIQILKAIVAQYGFTISETDITNYANYYFCSMMDMAEQCPGIEVEFNIYPKIFEYKNFMPNQTLREFLDAFCLLTGTSAVFDPISKTLSLKPFSDTLTDSPYYIERCKEDGLDFIENKAYSYAYKTISEDLKTDDQKAFFVYADDSDATKLEQLFLPFHSKNNVNSTPTRRAATGGTTSTTSTTLEPYTQQIGKSIIFAENITEDYPTPRCFLLNNGTISTVNFSINADSGIFKTKILPLISSRTGKILTIETYLSKIEIAQLSTHKKIHYSGVEWLLNQYDVQLTSNRLNLVKMELERIK